MIKDPEIAASEEFIHELKQAVPEAHFDRVTRLLYSTDASIYQMMPVGVAMPRNADEICAAVEIAAKHAVPILPRGGGSSLAGQAIGHALILDLSRYMDQVLDIDLEGTKVRTQPGITLGRLNQELASSGLMYGPDPASADRATMGGILGNNSTGAHSIVYGMTVDHVVSTDVVLSDASRATFDAFEHLSWSLRGKRPGLEGSLYRGLEAILERYITPIAARYPQTFRQVAGYNLNKLVWDGDPNLAKLIVGSEGTLGVITEMELNLVPIPKVRCLAMVHFDELEAAMEAVPIILESQPAAIEVLDKMMLDLTRDRLEYHRLLTFIEGDPAIVLLVEYAGDREAELETGIIRLRRKLKENKHRGPVIIIKDPTEQARVWHVRKLGLGILMSIRGDAKPIPFIEDAAVPVEHLADYVTQISEYSHSVGVDRVAMYAHASAGCIHIRPLVNLKQEAGVRQLRQIAQKSVELVIRYGGTTSGEHGEGIARGEFSEMLFGYDLVQAFHEVKNLFDPIGLLNPGKVVNTPQMDDETLLRFGTSYSVPYEIQETAFSFEHDGGYAGAVEMCNGAGVCRQLGQGVMCPSFQATKDEAHSTRGRANILRAAMTGSLGTKGMTSKEVFDVLDLCLSCHACKSECPSAVDMAKLKAEFLHQYYKKHRRPLLSRLFGRVATYNRFGQRFRPITNWLLRGPGKWMLTRLGVHEDRDLPVLASKTFSAWHRSHVRSTPQDSQSYRREIVFFHDSFTEHHHPEIGQASIRVLEALGLKPIVLYKKACCGRPAVSKGMLNHAKKLARRNLELLAPHARLGTPIVGIEPSCMTMLKEEYRDLVPGDDADIVAKNVMMLEDFIAQTLDEADIDIKFGEGSRRVLFHAHCQQKAIFGTNGTTSLLHHISNCQTEEIPSGCCGMAGSFGYEAEHYDLSLKIFNETLAPFLENIGDEVILCASGTSCRDQIEHVTGREAFHPIEVFAQALIKR
jgi:FAD/FMN-containing dehydrogenase/Fe-S oxidoreductase